MTTTRMHATTAATTASVSTSLAAALVTSVLVTSVLVLGAQTTAEAAGTTGPGDAVPGFTALRGDQEPAVAGDGQITALAIQSSGKIVVAQHSSAGTTLRRLHPDGSPDPSWGDGGRTPAGAGWIDSLVVLPDDRVATTGSDLRQFTATGFPDASFSGDGVVPLAVDVGYTATYGKLLIREPGGRLVVVGETFYGSSDWDVFAQRWHADGSPDEGFRHQRHAYFASDATADNLVSGALPDPNGGYHLVGKSAPFLQSAVPRSWKLNPLAHTDGEPSTLPLPASTDWAWIPGLTADTAFVVGYGDGGAYVSKLDVNPAGLQVDGTWGQNWHVALPLPEFVDAGAVQPDGKLVLAGRSGLFRILPDGTLDPDFDSAPSVPSGHVYPYAVALAADGSILRAGSAAVPGTTGTHPFVDQWVGRQARLDTAVSLTSTAPLRQTTSVVVRNNGPDPAVDAVLMVEAPDGVTAIVERPAGTCTSGTCRLGTVPAGGSITVTVVLTSPTSASGTLIVSAASSTYDDDPADQRSSLAFALTPAGAPTSTPSTTPSASAVPAVISVVRRPAIRGTTAVGRKLRASTGTWSATPTAYTYRWLRNGKAVRRATSRTYVVTRKDVGRRIVVRVTAVRAGYADGVATSRAVRIRGARAASQT